MNSFRMKDFPTSIKRLLQKKTRKFRVLSKEDIDELKDIQKCLEPYYMQWTVDALLTKLCSHTEALHIAVDAIEEELEWHHKNCPDCETVKHFNKALTRIRKMTEQKDD